MRRHILAEESEAALLIRLPDGPQVTRFRRLAGAGEGANLLGVHVNTVRRWRNTGISKVYRVGPRRDRKFRRQEVDAFLKE